MESGVDEGYRERVRGRGSVAFSYLFLSVLDAQIDGW